MTDTPADLRTQIKAAIFRLMPPRDGGPGLTLPAATARLAAHVYRQALDAGRTPERAAAMGLYVTQVGTEIADAAVASGMVTADQIRNS